MKLYIDTREPRHVKAKFQSMATDYPDLEVELKPLPTGDFQWTHGIIERKSIDDFISSITGRNKRQDGSVYHRLDTQLQRLKESDLPIKIILLHGDLGDCYSGIHPHSVLGMIASIQAQGVNVMWIPEDIDYPYLIYRIMVKSDKYLGQPEHGCLSVETGLKTEG